MALRSSVSVPFQCPFWNTLSAGLYVKKMLLNKFCLNYAVHAELTRRINLLCRFFHFGRFSFKARFKGIIFGVNNDCQWRFPTVSATHNAQHPFDPTRGTPLSSKNGYSALTLMDLVHLALPIFGRLGLS